MKTSKLIFSILSKNEKESNEYFSHINVSNQKTEIKFGYVDDKISINFFIHGISENKNISLLEKLEFLFNTDSDLTGIDEYLENIKEPYTINFSPYLKINEDPAIHAFRISIKHAGL